MIPGALIMVAGLSGLAACDPGYEFTVRNQCDAPMTVDLRDSDEFDQSGTGGAVTIEPHSTSSWSQIETVEDGRVVGTRSLSPPNREANCCPRVNNPV